MATRLRKMLGDRDAPCTQALLRLIESQSKATVCAWCLNYAQQRFLPIFEKHCPGDSRPRNALHIARDYLGGTLNYSQAKSHIWYESDDKTGGPAVRAAEDAIGQAASVVRYPSKWHALAVYFYGAAAIAYDRVGCNESAEVYASIAEEVCADMTSALRMAGKEM